MQIKSTVSFSLLLSFIFLFAFFQPVKGQGLGESNQQDSKSSSSFSGFSQLSVPGGYTNFFYLDELGIELAAKNIPYETSINERTYSLGPNDMVTLDVDGSQSMLLRGLVVNSQGDLIIPTIGNTSVTGLSIDSAETRLEKHFNQTYKSVSIDLTLDKPRMQQIHLTGDIDSPGKYSFPAQTRVSEVVKWIISQQPIGKTKKAEKSKSDLQNTAEEGPSTLMPSSMLQEQMSGDNFTSNQGQKTTSQRLEPESYLDTFNRNYITDEPYSLRNIVINHRDGSQDTVDLVTYFATGNLETNPYIRDGDVLKLYKLSRWSSRISISGAVTHPIETEYNASDTLSELISLAGGFAPDADSGQVNVYRKFNNNVHKVTVNKADYDEFQLEPNDRVVVPINQSAQTTQSVWIYGQISSPGQYPIVEGETTADKLLEMAGGLTVEALPRGAYLKRTSSNQFPESKIKDEIIDLDRSELKRTSTQTLEGLEYLNLETRVSEGKVPIDFSDESQMRQLKLYDGDKLYIPRDRNTIFVFGQVNKPGYYPYSNTMTAHQYISQAGGFTLPAEENDIFVIKAGSRSWYKPENTQIRSGDMIFVNRRPYTQYAESKQLRNESIRLIITGISTITSIITTYLVITR